MSNPKFQGLATRALTGSIAAIAALAMTLAHPYSFAILLIAACIIGMREWEGLNLKKTVQFRLVGLLYIVSAVTAMAWLRIHPFSSGDDLSQGAEWIIGLFALVWATDIAAYITGRLIGGPKIAPRVSPNKTWAGLLGGMAASAAIAYGLSSYVPTLPGPHAVLIGAVIAIIAQAGDFLESGIKRRAGVKDSGTLLPGHGGLLDRVDGLLPASLAYAILVYIYAPV